MKTKFMKKAISTVMAAMILLIPFPLSGNASAVSNQSAAKIADRFNEEVSALLSSQDTTYFFGEMKMRIGSKSLEIDGKTTTMDVTPEITNGRTMLPIRHVAEAVGAKVTWDGKTKSATIKSQTGDTITCTIGKKTMSVNGTGQSLDVAPYVKNGRTYLPIRAISEALDFDVQWEQKTKTVTLTAPYQTSRIIALADETLEVDYLGAQTSLYDGSGMWVLQFGSPAEAKVGMALLKAEGVTVEPDTYILPISSGVSIDLWNPSENAYSWGVSDCHFDNFVVNNPGVFQKRGTVAVVDTGVDATHPFLSGKVLPGYDFIDGDQDPFDENRHGTHVAGTVIDCVRNAPVSILPIRVLGADGHGTTVSVAAGVKYAANHDADVINMSLGGGHSPSQEAAIEYAVDHGCLVCVSAGNDNADTAGQCPAHITDGGVVVVSAGDAYHSKASFSNYGSSVDLMAPGVNIKSCVPGNRFILLDGTSMATPHVSAAAILLDLAWGKQLSSVQLEEKIHTATSYGTWHDSVYGYGFLDMSKASVPSSSTPTPTPTVTPTPTPVVTPTPSPTPEPEDTREVIDLELIANRDSYGYVQSFDVRCNVLNGSTMTGWSVTLQSGSNEPFTNRFETNCVGQCWVTKKMGFSLYGKTWNVYGTVKVNGHEYHTDTITVSDPAYPQAPDWDIAGGNKYIREPHISDAGEGSHDTYEYQLYAGSTYQINPIIPANCGVYCTYSAKAMGRSDGYGGPVEMADGVTVDNNGLITVSPDAHGITRITVDFAYRGKKTIYVVVIDNNGNFT